MKSSLVFLVRAAAGAVPSLVLLLMAFLEWVDDFKMEEIKNTRTRRSRSGSAAPETTLSESPQSLSQGGTHDDDR